MEERTPHVTITLQDIERITQEMFRRSAVPESTLTVPNRLNSMLSFYSSYLDSGPKNTYPVFENPDDMIIWESGPIRDMGPATACARLKEEYRDEYERLKVNSMDVMSLVYKALKDSENEKAMESTTKNKLRLIVTDQCHNNCPLCCNRQFNMDEVPVVSRWDYDEICITGGEPLISLKKTRRLIRLIKGIREIWKATGHEGKIYIYSATRKGFLLAKIVPYIDGIVYTPHYLQDMFPLYHFSRWVMNNGWHYPERNKSFRLNVFPDMMPYLEQLDQGRMEIWKIKQIEWVDNCPVPEGEDFRRIHNMY